MYIPMFFFLVGDIALFTALLKFPRPWDSFTGEVGVEATENGLQNISFTHIYTYIHINIIYSYIHQGGLSNYHVPVRAAASYPFTHGPEEFSPTASSSPHRGTSRKGIPASMESHGSTSHLLSTSAALLSPSDRYVHMYVHVCMHVCKNKCICMYVCMYVVCMFESVCVLVCLHI